MRDSLLSHKLLVPEKARKGFVLISVLLLGMVFISCATAFAWFARLQIRSVSRERSALVNRSMAQVLVASVISGVTTVSKEMNADSPLQEWFKPFLFPADNLGMWAVQVSPLDDKIPIRGIFLPDKDTLRNELRRTWDDLWVKLGRPELSYLVLDFMDKNKKPRLGSEERDYFINRIPYDMSEFLLLPEFTPELLNGSKELAGLSDYCTLWCSNKINLNSAPVHVMAILPGMDISLAGLIAEARNKDVLKSIDNLRSIPGFPAKSATQLLNLAGFKSRYFSLRIEFLEESAGGSAYNIIFDGIGGTIVRWEEI